MTEISPRPVAPKISIVMAAHNEELNIAGALDSIRTQTFVDWELIVVDDGSTDGTAEVVKRYVEKDSRISFVVNETNLQLSASLNKAIGLARADVIARADADDINLPERLTKQYGFLETHQEIDVLGTGAYLLDATGARVNAVSHPVTHAELSTLSFLKIQFFHPSVMMRRRFFERAGLYDPQYPNAEDKEIWLRGLAAGCSYANLSEPLIEYRTDGFVKSWRSIFRHGFSLFRIAREHNIRGGYVQAAILFLYTAAIKMRVRKPRSLRSNSLDEHLPK